MCTDPAGRAGLSQRGSNSEMRVGEGRRSVLQMVKNGGFSKEQEGREALMRRMERLKR